MSHLTGKQKRQIQRAIDHLDRAIEFIRSPRVAVAIREKMATTTLHYTRALDGAILYEIDKEIGSDLCGLAMGHEELCRLLESAGEDRDAA